MKRVDHLPAVHVPWLERLPPTWRVVRFGRLARLSVRSNVEHDVRLLSLSSTRGVVAKEYDDENRIRTGEELERYWAVRPGHLVVNPMWLSHGSIGAASISGVISPDYRVYDVAKHLDARFLAHLLKSNEYLGLYALFVRGDTTYDRRVSKQDFHSIPIIVPPRSEQRAIADFLDRKTAAIAALIEKKERLLETLTERWLAFVGRAVTKGLGATSAMRETGIEVLPREIPAHWTALRLKRLLLRIEQGWSPECFSRPAEEGEWGVLKAGAVNTGHLDERENKALPPDVPPLTEYEVREGDLLMSRASGSPKHIGAVGLVGSVRARLLLCDKLYRLRLRAKLLDRRFARWALRAPYVRSQIGLASTGQSTLQNIGQDDVRDIWFILPTLREQEAIAAELAHEESVHSALKRLLEGRVALLHEYRQALITAAVTGQIDVTKEAA